MSDWDTARVSSEQAVYHTVRVDIDLQSCGSLGKTRHRHDLSRKKNDISRTGRKSCLSYSEGKSFRASEQFRIIGQRILGLGNADRQIFRNRFLETLDRLLASGRISTSFAPYIFVATLYILSSTLNH